MSVGGYVAGWALLAAVVAPLAIAARTARRRMLPGWIGAPAWLAEIVVVLALIVLVSEGLGVAGAFRAGMLVAASIAVGAVLTLALRRAPPVQPAPPPSPPVQAGPVTTWLAFVGALLLLAQWGAGIRLSVRGGMYATDTIWYHMPFAARWVQDGSIGGLHFVELEPMSAYHPANSEVLHAVGIALFSSHDVLSPFLNAALLAVALLAGWCIGRPWGVAPLTMLATALALALPTVWVNNAGQAGSDLPGVTFLLGAVALLVNARACGPGLFLSGAAAGLAIGTKLTLAGPVAALAVVTIALAPQGRRLVHGAGWGLAAAATGGFWYVRNLVETGNPLPWVRLDLGPIDVPAPQRPLHDDFQFSLAHYLFDGDVWDSHLIPGLGWAGWAWPALLGLGAAGAAGAVLARGDALRRGVGLLALACAAIYLVTPNGAAGREGDPWSFGLNLRYAAPAVALGLIALPLWLASGSRRRRLLVLGVLLATLLVTLAVRSGPWQFRGEAVPVALGLAAAAGAGLLLRRAPRRPALGGAAALTAAILAAGFFVQRDYVGNRYPETGPLAFARELDGVRIGVFGSVYNYPLYGDELSNRVRFLGRRVAHGGFRRLRGCREWRRALNNGGFAYVVVAPVVSFNLQFEAERKPVPPEVEWTRSDPAALSVHDVPPTFFLSGPLDPDRCPA